jgi:CubicO group peptidase (beta-lactamase class C family)
MTSSLRSGLDGARVTMPLSSADDWRDMWNVLSLQFARDRHTLRSLTDEFNRIKRDDLMSVVVMRRGLLIYEHYFNETGSATLHNVCSVAKSITALLVGATIDRGIIRSAEDVIGEYLPQLEEKQRNIRLSDLLTMRAGFDGGYSAISQLSYADDLDDAADWKEFTLSRRVSDTPGTFYKYDSAAAFLAGMTVEGAVKRPLDSLFEEWILAPLGYTRFAWRDDAQGCVPAHGGLRLTARCMASIGQMMVGYGRYRLRAVLSERWVRECLTPRVAVGDTEPYADGIGYLWFSKSLDVGGKSTIVHFASGNGGNRIYVVPALDLSIAVASHAYGQRYGHDRSETILSLITARLSPCWAAARTPSTLQTRNGEDNAITRHR